MKKRQRQPASHMVLLLLSTLGISALAAEPPGFAMWTASELQSRDTALSRDVGPDDSSRVTLGDFGDHRFRMLYRDRDGNPEQHDAMIDVVTVQSGGGTLVLGGTMIDKRSTTVGEWIGTSLEGGQRFVLKPGDIVQIPSGVPHAFLVDTGGHLTYVLLKIPG